MEPVCLCSKRRNNCLIYTVCRLHSEVVASGVSHALVTIKGSNRALVTSLTADVTGSVGMAAFKVFRGHLLQNQLANTFSETLL